jgi:hypothetical protein
VGAPRRPSRAPRLSAALVVALSSGLLACAGAAPAGVQRADCTPGLRKSGTVKVRVFCGPAHAAVRFGRDTYVYGGRTYAFRNGSCMKTARTLYVRIGVQWLPYPSTELPRTRFFALIIDASRDGTYHTTGSSLILSFSAPGFAFVLTAGTVHLTGDRSSGSFSGLIGGRDVYAYSLTAGSVSGSFSC